MADYACG